MWFEAGQGKVVVSLPGVPYEMEGLMTEEVVPRLRARFALPTTLYHTVSTAGMGESSLAALLEEWEAHVRAKGMSLAYLPSPGQVKLRLGVTGPAEARAALEAELADEVAALVSLVRPYLLGHGELGVAEAVLQALAAKGQTVATAESCTGGTIASMLTAIPGASASMWGGVVAYDNRVKEAVLKVPEALLRTHGAVSEPVVIAMAEGGRRELGTTWAVATSGVAGPSGGTPDKPVGMVWMAVAGPDGTRAWCHHLGRVRERIVERASRRALTHLFLAIQEGGVKGLED
jgi:nicotinamide-nucleotide amidase